MGLIDYFKMSNMLLEQYRYSARSRTEENYDENPPLETTGGNHIERGKMEPGDEASKSLTRTMRLSQAKNVSEVQIPLFLNSIHDSPLVVRVSGIPEH